MNPVPAAPHLRKRRSRARGPMWLQSRWLRRNHPAGGGWGRSHRAGALPRAAAIFPRRSTIDEPGDEDGADVLVAGVRLRTAGGGGRRVRRARAAGAPPGRPAGGVRDGGALPDGPRARPPRRGAGGRARALVDGRGGGMALLRGDRALLREPLRAGAHRHPRAGRGDAAGRPLLPRRVGRARARRTRLDADDLKAIAYAWAEAAEKHRTSAGSGPSRTGAPTASCADGALSSPTRGGGAVDPSTLGAHPGAPPREESHAGCSPAVAGSYQIRVKSGASEAWVRGPAIDPSACKVPRSRMLQRDRPQLDFVLFRQACIVLAVPPTQAVGRTVDASLRIRARQAVRRLRSAVHTSHLLQRARPRRGGDSHGRLPHGCRCAARARAAGPWVLRQLPPGARPRPLGLPQSLPDPAPTPGELLRPDGPTCVRPRRHGGAALGPKDQGPGHLPRPGALQPRLLRQDQRTALGVPDAAGRGLVGGAVLGAAVPERTRSFPALPRHLGAAPQEHRGLGTPDGPSALCLAARAPQDRPHGHCLRWPATARRPARARHGDHADTARQRALRPAAPTSAGAARRPPQGGGAPAQAPRAPGRSGDLVAALPRILLVRPP